MGLDDTQRTILATLGVGLLVPPLGGVATALLHLIGSALLVAAWRG